MEALHHSTEGSGSVSTHTHHALNHHTSPSHLHTIRRARLISPPSASPMCSVKLKAFSKFEDTTAALSAATAICDGKLDRGLRTFLSDAIGSKSDKVTLGVADSKLGGLIKDKLSIQCVFDNSVQELVRGIRQHMNALISGLAPSDTAAFQLGLAHSLARYKLKFSPDKVDTMIIQAIALLDELDKELNTYAMRVREWSDAHTHHTQYSSQHAAALHTAIASCTSPRVSLSPQVRLALPGDGQDHRGQHPVRQGEPHMPSTPKPLLFLCTARQLVSSPVFVQHKRGRAPPHAWPLILSHRSDSLV